VNTETGDDIVIEERDYQEVTHVRGANVASYLDEDEVSNYAFDVTSHENIEGIITEIGIIREPFKKNIREVL
jgi:methylthioribose-1-phosphate isomerase